MKIPRMKAASRLPHTRLFFNLFLCLLLFPCLLMAGCGGMTASHLPRNPWHGEASQRLEMRYLTFHYETTLAEDGDVLLVTGEAFPDVTRLPDWASWYGEASVSVYLVDSEGRVLSVQKTHLKPRPLDREAGFPIKASFTLGVTRQPLHIAFGYSLSLLNGKPGENVRRILVAEGALEK